MTAQHWSHTLIVCAFVCGIQSILFHTIHCIALPPAALAPDALTAGDPPLHPPASIDIAKVPPMEFPSALTKMIVPQNNSPLPLSIFPTDRKDVIHIDRQPSNPSIVDAATAKMPPMQFPIAATNMIVAQNDNQLPPSLFPTNGKDVIRILGRQSSELKKLPPVVFPDHELKLLRPTDAKIEEILAKQRSRTLAFRNGQDSKQDAVLLEEGDAGLPQNQPEEQYGSHTNNLLVSRPLASDDSLVVDRPHLTSSSSHNSSWALSVSALMLSVLSACVVLYAVVWPKYKQRSSNSTQERQLLTNEVIADADLECN